MTQATTMRIGVLGLHHDHVWGNLDELNALRPGSIVAAVDPHSSLREKVQSLYGCKVYEDYEELLNREQLTAVYIFAGNRSGAELAVTALNRGLHVLIEKPMAADLSGAVAMNEAATANGRLLMVNWPFAWWPQLQTALHLAKQGDIGRLWQVKYRAAHQGPRELGCSDFFCEWLFDENQNGAGALMDYCCYGAVMADVLLGTPESVQGMQGNLCKRELPVEDNALLMMRYPHAMATSEASWTQVGKLSSYTTTIYGTEGTLVVEPRQGGRLFKATEELQEGIELPVNPSPTELQSASAHFLWAIESGGDLFSLCDPVHGRNAQAILEAGIQATRERREVDVLKS